MENTVRYVLITSILYLITGGFGIIGIDWDSSLPAFSLLIMFISWIILLVFVHLDIKATGRKQIWSLVPFFFGGIGGLIYYFTREKVVSPVTENSI